MASMEFKNNARSTVADSPLAAGATTLNVATGEGANFPALFPFKLTLFDDSSYPDSGLEIVKCTGRTADALTIVRAQEGTADSEHANGERVAMLITAGHFNDATTGIVTKLDTIETSAEVNNISDVNANDLTDASDSTLHYHATDRARANHTGSQAASTISDFDTEVSNNTDVAANTAKNTNATHTGDVTGSEALTVDKTAITNKGIVTAIGSDHVIIADASDAGNLKKALISDFASAGGDMAASTYDPTTVAGDAFAMDNMVEGTTTKVLTGSERSSIASNVTHAASTSNPHTVTKTQLSLENVENLKVNLIAIFAPTVNDDTGDGYEVGSRWFDVDNDKEYVCMDNSVAAAVWIETTAKDDQVASEVANTPAGDIVATDVQAAIDELDTEKAPLESPTFTGEVGMSSASPKLTIHNTEHEDTDYGRESELIFKGEQSGGEETTLGKIQVAHDGVADDQKGIMSFKVNDGADGDVPTTAMTILADGNVGIGTNSPTGKLEVVGGLTVDSVNIGTAVAANTSKNTYPSADATKLGTIEENANDYTHPTGDGNKHVPANSTTNDNKVLTAGAAAGVYTWETNPAGFADPMTTRGDIIIKNASNVTARLGIGTNGQVLKSDGSDITWAAESSGGSSIVNAMLWAEAAYLPETDFVLTGTVTMTSGSTAVTGSGTAFTTELQVNDYIKLDADGSAYWAKVSTIESATALTLTAVYNGTGGVSAGSGSGNPASRSELLGEGRHMGWSVLEFDDTLSNPDGGERAGWRIPMPDYDGGNIVLTGVMKPATTPTGAVTFVLNIRTIGLATSDGFDKAVTADTGVNMSFSLNTTELNTDVVFATATIDPTNVVSNDMMVIEVNIDSSSTLSGDGQLLYIMMKYTRS